jgi:CheY-like chemotaxis protein
MADDEQKPKETLNLDNTSTGRWLEQRPGSGPLERGLPWVLEFRVVGTNATIQTQLKEVMVLGREDPDHEVFPEIDLSPYHAYTHGVSRRHAVIQVKHGHIIIKDLDSTNGTRLNDFDLMADTDYRLRHGDELTLGQLKLQVMFSVIPAREDLNAPDDAPLHLNIPLIGNGQRVLVVEDDPDVGGVLKNVLEQAGFRVTPANSAVEATTQVTNDLPHAIVLDLMLPDLHGPDFVRYVRKNSDVHIPILIIGMPGSLHMNRALDAGADLFLAKPVSIEELIDLMGRAMVETKE